MSSISTRALIDRNQRDHEISQYHRMILNHMMAGHKLTPTQMEEWAAAGHYEHYKMHDLALKTYKKLADELTR